MLEPQRLPGTLRTYTAISALQERNVTAVLRMLIAWHPETAEQRIYI